MYASINHWSFPEGMNLKDSMTLAKKEGYEGFEPAIAKEGEISLTSTDQEVLKVKEMAGDIGIRLASLASGLSWATNPVSPDQQVRAEAKRQLMRQIECASLLGVDAVLWVPGTVGGADSVHYDTAWDLTVENLNGIKDFAEKMGVTVGVENVWNNFLLSPLEMRALIDQIASPRVGVYLDVGNIIKFGYPEQWIKILAKRIARIHVKDFRRAVGNFGGFVDLLAGDVDFPAVIAALKDVGYEGPLTAEMSAEGCFPADIVYRTARAFEIILGKR